MNNQIETVLERTAADLSEQLARINKSTAEFTNAVSNTTMAILKFNLTMTKLKECEYQCKLEQASLFTAWYYERQYRKTKLLRIKLERRIRLC